MNAAQKEIQRAIGALKRLGEVPETENGRWLWENRRMLLGFLFRAKKLFRRRENAREIAGLWEDCRAFFLSGAQAGEESLGTFFGTKDRGLPYVSALQTALFAAGSVASALGECEAKTAVKTLFALRRVEFSRLFAPLCETERLLSQIPGLAFSRSDEKTKARYRARLLRLAKKRGELPTQTAKRLLKSGGAALNAEPKKTLPAALLTAGVFLCAVCGAYAAFLSLRLRFGISFPAALALGLTLAPLFALPLCSLLRPFLRRLSSRLFRPAFLPSLDPQSPDVKLPKTLVVVSMLLPEPGETAALGERLKVLKASASGAGIALLLDKPGAAAPETPEDPARVRALRRVLSALNADGGGFAFALRSRVFSPTEGNYTGFERKRGAVEALVKYLADGTDGFEEVCGDAGIFRDVEYLLALDEDATLPFGTLKKLLGVAAHPVNRARYGCFSPRTESGRARERTLFAEIFSGGGLSSYDGAVPDFGMDAFSEGVFCGKGLINVSAYREKCVGAFPEGRVLSHDILEGALLGAAVVSDAALAEDFPSAPAALFARAHRWARGDVQNLWFLFRRVNGSFLPPLARLRLLSNVCRALTPACCLGLLLLAPFTTKALTPLFLLLSLGGVLSDALCSCVSALLRQGFTRRFSRGLPLWLRELLRGALETALLPWAAFAGLDGVCRGLWRSFTKKHTLEWTTAGAAAGKRPGLFPAVFLPLFCALLLLTGGPACGIPALFFLLGVPVSFGALSFQRQREKRLSPERRRQLAGWAGAAWGYFEEQVTPENGFLPPDNVQELPVANEEKRTSPTNIGLYLAGLPAAADLGLLSPEEMLKRASLTLTSVEKLEKYRGLLYNWYSTADLSVLRPRFVSSVDCGNFLVCLEVLRAGCRDYGAPRDLLERIDRLQREADLGALFDRARGLFFVGFDAERGAPTDALYETYLSETLLTSLYAVAKGEAPPSHYARLRRDVCLKGGRLWPLSFSGTFFEYFMPALFLPLYENTYRSEALGACLFANRRERAGRGKPWGKSESAFHAFDDLLHYSYRANGVSRLALDPEARNEKVYAPYAAFLALAVDPAGAMEDLSAFLSLGAYGKYGFYEAVDFENRGAHEPFVVVRSFMAHHLGMSFLAAANALCASSTVRRFTDRPEMKAVCTLLEEGLPAPNVPPPPKRRRVKMLAPEKKRPRAYAEGDAALYENTGGALVFDGEQAHALSGALELFEAGSLRVCLKVGERVVPLPPCMPTQTALVAGKTAGGTELRSALALLPGEGAFALPVRLRAGEKGARVTLAVSFTPRLLSPFAGENHRAFSDLRLRIEPLPDLCAALFRRVGTKGCFAVGFADLTPFSFETDRELLTGDDALFGPFSNRANAPVPGFALRAKIPLREGKPTERVLLFCPGANPGECLRQLARLRKARLPALSQASPDALDAEEALWLRALLRLRPSVGEPLSSRAPLSALWERGVSGDRPLIRAQPTVLGEKKTEKLLRFYARLRLLGLGADLLLFTDGGDYADPQTDRLKAAARKLVPLAPLSKSPGVFVLQRPSLSPAFLGAAAAARGIDLPGLNSAPPDREERLLPARPAGPEESVPVPGGWYLGTKTPRPWGMTYANPVFGTLLTNRSLGCTWALNSRLNPLTVGGTDRASPRWGERLLLETPQGVFDLLCGAAVYFYENGALYLSKAGKHTLRVAVGVFPKGCGKRVRVRAGEGSGEVSTLRFEVRPALSETENARFFVRRVESETGLVFVNPANTAFPGFLGVFCDGARAFTQGEKGVLTLPLSPGGIADVFLVFSRSLPGLQKVLEAGKRQALFDGAPKISSAAAALPASLTLLPHQTVDTRIFARAFLSQNSGAFGFRDQLQDCMNALCASPKLLLRQILRCSAAQFPEGDVLHWFHVLPAPKPRLLGVRTRCRDDLLWLPLAAAEYADFTGESSFLSLPVRFLSGEPLSPKQKESCREFFPGEARASVFEHCRRALEKGARDLGPHGLPYFGACDWNDAFSELEKGESVFLAMFLRLVLLRFLPLCPEEQGKAYRSLADRLEENVMAVAFNGQYFLRGFYPDGTPLGDEGGGACEIDLLPQSFAVFAGIGTPEQRKTALKTAFDRLYDPKAGLTRLFAPPFTEQSRRAGYVNDYPPGVRENGGQYSHAAVWFALALRKEGLEEQAKAVLDGVRPDKRDPEVYRNEPYYVSADVLAAPAPAGQGGWSGYTGAAGWLWRAMRET